MKAFEALTLFRAQIERRSGLKVVLVPSPVKEAAPTIRLSLRKVVAQRSTVRERTVVARELRMTLALDGKVESETGLRLAAEACESLLDFLGSATRLEDALGNPVPSTTISVTVNQDDGILEDPENGAVAWIRDEHFVAISIPA